RDPPLQPEDLRQASNEPGALRPRVHVDGPLQRGTALGALREAQRRHAGAPLLHLEGVRGASALHLRPGREPGRAVRTLTVRVHVLAGCSELLEPQVLAPEDAQSLIGPSVRTASAAWLSPGPESRYHSALQDDPGDQR